MRRQASPGLRVAQNAIGRTAAYFGDAPRDRILSVSRYRRLRCLPEEIRTNMRLIAALQIELDSIDRDALPFEHRGQRQNVTAGPRSGDLGLVQRLSLPSP